MQILLHKKGNLHDQREAAVALYGYPPIIKPTEVVDDLSNHAKLLLKKRNASRALERITKEEDQAGHQSFLWKNEISKYKQQNQKRARSKLLYCGLD